MAKARWCSPRIVRKALPALLIIIFIFISLLFVVNYTDAFYLVILVWIVVPVAAVRLYRKIREKFTSD